MTMKKRLASIMLLICLLHFSNFCTVKVAAQTPPTPTPTPPPTTPQDVTIGCGAGPYTGTQNNLRRPRGDSNIWTFRVVAPTGREIEFTQGPTWSYPGKGAATTEWGSWGGGDSTSSLTWSAPQVSAAFSVTVSGKGKCKPLTTGAQEANGAEAEFSFNATWSGQVFDVDIYEVDASGNRGATPLPARDPNDTSKRGAHNVAVRRRLLAVPKNLPTVPAGGTTTYLWSIGGSNIKDYVHNVDEENKHRTTALSAADRDTANVSFFWTNVANPAPVSITVTVTGYPPVTKTVDFNVSQTSDPNVDVYTVDADNDRSPGFNVLQGHNSWHGGVNVDGEVPNASGASWGDAGMTSTAYNGAAFLNWHWEFVKSHLAWRGTFNVGGYAGANPPPGTLARPQYLRLSPSAASNAESPVYNYVRLGEYQSLDQVGDDAVNPWHNNGHMSIAAATGYAIMGSLNSPGTPDDTFWKWHTIVDGPRQDWAGDQATVVAITPANNVTVTTLPTSIIIRFNRKVSLNGGVGGANTIRITAGALKVNGSAATTITDEDATNPFTTYRFTGFSAPAAGKITVTLTGTASFASSPTGGWSFTYKP